MKAKPIVKWAGGKSYLLPEIRKILDNTVVNLSELIYCEPMVGGGAVFFSEHHRFKAHAINDINDELINLYRVVRGDVKLLIEELNNGTYFYVHKSEEATKENYLKIRADEPTTNLRKAARTIYLLKTCFNGLMRKNQSGKFNTPMGSYRNPKICDEELLRTVSRILRSVGITCWDAVRFIKRIDVPSFFFVDPPYHNESGKKFTSYSGRFNDDDQKALATALLESGHKFIYTNRATSLIQGLFPDEIKLKIVPLRHSIQPKYTAKMEAESELMAYNL